MKNGNFYLGMGAFTISSAMIPLMSVFTREKSVALATTLAVTFWVALVAGIVLTILFGKSTKPMTKKKGRAFIPFGTKETMIIDPLFIICLIATLVLLIAKINVSWLQIVLLVGDVYLLELHFLFSLTVKSKQIRRRNQNEEA